MTEYEIWERFIYIYIYTVKAGWRQWGPVNITKDKKNIVLLYRWKITTKSNKILIIKNNIVYIY